MKKTALLLLAIIMTLGLTACGETKKASTETETKQEEKQADTKAESKEEDNQDVSDITSGALFDKVTSLHDKAVLRLVKNNDLGTKQVMITVKVSSSTPKEELKTYRDTVAKIIVNSKQELLDEKADGVTFTMYVGDTPTSCLIIYKKKNGEFKLEDTVTIDQKYKDASANLD